MTLELLGATNHTDDSRTEFHVGDWWCSCAIGSMLTNA